MKTPELSSCGTLRLQFEPEEAARRVGAEAGSPRRQEPSQGLRGTPRVVWAGAWSRAQLAACCDDRRFADGGV